MSLSSSRLSCVDWKPPSIFQSMTATERCVIRGTVTLLANCSVTPPHPHFGRQMRAASRWGGLSDLYRHSLTLMKQFVHCDQLISSRWSESSGIIFLDSAFTEGSLTFIYFNGCGSSVSHFATLHSSLFGNFIMSSVSSEQSKRFVLSPRTSCKHT